MDGTVIEHVKISHRQSRNVRGEEPEHLAKFALGNARLENVFFVTATEQIMHV